MPHNRPCIETWETYDVLILVLFAGNFMKDLYGNDSSASNYSMYSGGDTYLGFPDASEGYIGPREANMDAEAIMYAARANLLLFVSPVLLLVGIAGNLLALVILEKLSREVFSTCAYLAALTLADSLLLFIRCGNDWCESIYTNVSYMLMVQSQSVCKVYPFLYNFLFHFSRWLLVAAAIEGFMSTRYPHRPLQTLPRAKATMLLLTVLLVCTNVHYFWSFEVMKQDNGLECGFSKYSGQCSEEFQNIVWPLLDMFIGDLLPDAIILGCAAAMLALYLRGAHRGSPAHQRWRSRYTMDPDALDQVKLMVMALGFAHILLTAPSFLAVCYRYSVQKRRSTYQNETALELAGTLCSMVHYVFQGGKLFIYLAVCPKFRTEVRHRLRCCLPHRMAATPKVVDHPLIPPPKEWRDHTQSEQAEALVMNHQP